MNRQILLIIMYLFICKSIYSQIITHVDKIDSSYCFTLKNNTEDTVYLFDSYLEQQYYHEKYIHRYCWLNKQCKLSFLPILSLLSGKKIGSPMIIGGLKIARYGYVTYSFKPIAPKSNIHITIPSSAFYVKDYVRDHLEITTHKTAYFDDINKLSCETIDVEFAIYRDLGIMKIKDAFYLHTPEFARQAVKFEVLSIPVLISIEINEKEKR